MKIEYEHSGTVRFEYGREADVGADITQETLNRALDIIRNAKLDKEVGIAVDAVIQHMQHCENLIDAVSDLMTWEYISEEEPEGAD